jgi:Xaa-Pro aminopeptidase
MNKSKEVQTKIELVRGWLQRHEMEAMLINSQANFAWLTGGGGNYVYFGDAAGIAFLLVTPNRTYLLTNNIEARRLQEEQVAGLPFDTVTWPWQDSARARQMIAGLCDVSKTVSDLGSLGLPKVSDGLPDGFLGGFNQLRYTMSPPEIERYRCLGQDAAQALEAVCFSFEPGESELDIAASLAFQCQKRNILPLVNLVGGDERIPRYRHPLPTGNPVLKTALIALTGRRQGLHISLSRLVSIGPVDHGLLGRHRSVVKVDARYILESRTGVTLGDVFSRAIDQYFLEGFPREWELHHQGGLTGYAGREIFATPDNKYRLKVNQVLTWNPSITGTKSEDTILITADGVEILTRTGSWPELEVELPMGNLNRPAILVR